MAEVTEADREAANACFDFIDPAEQADAVKRTAPIFAAHREAAEKAERQAVADWLREKARSGITLEVCEAFTQLAGMFERGDHRKG